MVAGMKCVFLQQAKLNHVDELSCSWIVNMPPKKPFLDEPKMHRELEGARIVQMNQGHQFVELHQLK